MVVSDPVNVAGGGGRGRGGCNLYWLAGRRVQPGWLRALLQGLAPRAVQYRCMRKMAFHAECASPTHAIAHTRNPSPPP